MKASERFLFALVRAGIGTDDGAIVPENGIDWRKVFKKAAEQGVLAIAFDGMVRSGIEPPKEVMLNWIANVDRIEERYGRQKRVIGKLAACFDEHAIPVLLLKGYGLSLCYPRPEHRPCGDIDIWLYGKALQGDEALRSTFSMTIDEDREHHAVGTLDGVTIENHFEFLNTHHYTSNRIIERHLQRAAESGYGTLSVDGHPIRIPSPDFNALFLLRHTACHFATEMIGIRHLTDWAMFIKRYGKTVDWQELEKIARETNMHRFLFALCAITKEHLGVTPDDMPEFERDTEIERRITDEILYPKYSLKLPAGRIAAARYRMKRWWARRWKHRIVYSDSLAATFIRAVGNSLSGR